MATDGVFSRIYATMQEGTLKYGANTWREQSVVEHLNHIDEHVRCARNHFTDEDHLAHAVVRLLMVMEMESDGLA